MTADQPHHVAATHAEATAALRRAARAGWTAREGFALPERRWDLADAKIVCHGRITDPDTARLALLAAARGATVVATVDPDTDLGRAFLADLARIGRVTTGPGPAPDTQPPGPRLAPEQRALLDRLADGQTIAAAAAAEYLSLRTANRRIAEARAALGVRTTREAVLAWLRHRPEPPTQRLP